MVLLRFPERTKRGFCSTVTFGKKIDLEGFTAKMKDIYDA